MILKTLNASHSNFIENHDRKLAFLAYNFLNNISSYYGLHDLRCNTKYISEWPAFESRCLVASYLQKEVVGPTQQASQGIKIQHVLATWLADIILGMIFPSAGMDATRAP